MHSEHGDIVSIGAHHPDADVLITMLRGHSHYAHYAPSRTYAHHHAGCRGLGKNLQRVTLGAALAAASLLKVAGTIWPSPQG